MDKDKIGATKSKEERLFKEARSYHLIKLERFRLGFPESGKLSFCVGFLLPDCLKTDSQLQMQNTIAKEVWNDEK